MWKKTDVNLPSIAQLFGFPCNHHVRFYLQRVDIKMRPKPLDRGKRAEVVDGSYVTADPQQEVTTVKRGDFKTKASGR